MLKRQLPQSTDQLRKVHKVSNENGRFASLIFNLQPIYVGRVGHIYQVAMYGDDKFKFNFNESCVVSGKYHGVLATSWGFKNYGNYYQTKVDYYEFNLSMNEWIRIFETMEDIDADCSIISEVPRGSSAGNFFEDLSRTFFGLEDLF